MGGASRSVGRELEVIFDVGTVGGLSDGELLDRFNERRDAAGEAAFATVVRRHGPMVLEVCRRRLGDSHHAEDAFQAVFLVLRGRPARCAIPTGSVPGSAGWPSARAEIARRLDRARRREAEAPGLRLAVTASPEATAIEREHAEALRVEIERLPETFRLPLLLCYFEGLTLDEAARRLRWPAGTLRSRLARVREKIRRGLARRGVAMSTLATAAILDPPSASASVPPALVEATTRAAIHFASGTAAAGPAATIAVEVLRSLAIARAGLVTTVGIGLSAVALGVGWVGFAQMPGMACRGATRTVGRRSGPDPRRRPRNLRHDGRRPHRNPSLPPICRPRSCGAERRFSAWGEPVDRAIRDGARFLKSRQGEDGILARHGREREIGDDQPGGARPARRRRAVRFACDPAVLEQLRTLGPHDIHSTYGVSLQTMAYAAASPVQDRLRIGAGVRWLERCRSSPTTASTGPARGATTTPSRACVATTRTRNTPCSV